MKLLHSNILCDKRVIEKKSTSGLFLPSQNETVFDVVQVGPKVLGITIGMVLKPFKYCEPIEIPTEDGVKYLFNQDQIQDIADA